MITFRAADEDDARLLWKWANEEQVRENAFNEEPIPWETHLEWLNERLGSDSCYLFIAEADESPVGQIRFEMEDNGNATVDISVTKNQRGKGYGNKVIEEGTQHFLTINPEVTVHAYVKQNNKASVKAFQNAGYDLEGIENKKGYESYHLTYKLSRE